MSNVIHLHQPAYDGLLCECGSAWFTLRRTTTGAFDPPGAVCFDHQGRITGYTGHPVCADCGTPQPQESTP